MHRLDALDRMDSERAKCSRRSMHAAKTGLMQDLLTGKVRVKVDESEEIATHA